MSLTQQRQHHTLPCAHATWQGNRHMMAACKSHMSVRGREGLLEAAASATHALLRARNMARQQRYDGSIQITQ